MSNSEEEVRSRLPDMICVDLADFGERLVDDAGELDVSYHFKHPLYIGMGGILLELSQVRLPWEQRKGTTPLPSNLYILKNLSAPLPNRATATLDDAPVRVSTTKLKRRKPTPFSGQRLIVGRSDQATPKLDLPLHVSRLHMHVRVDPVSDNLRLADLGSLHGTRVYIDPEDDPHIVRSERREIRADGRQLPETLYEQRWFRDQWP